MTKTNQNQPTVLLIDDEPNILKTMNICFEDMGFKTTQFLNPEDALAKIKEIKFDLAFVDLKMKPIDGIALLEAIKKYSPKTTVVIITAHGSVESAVEAIKKGAHHYIQKPFNLLELQLLAQKALEYHKLKRELEELKGKSPIVNIITQNDQMLNMIELAEKVAETELSVLIEGESGTGKELFAHLIFKKSTRSDKPYIKINCAALPENLLESELFGHVKGAFTGAVKDRKGRFELADHGTIFLDEIAELSPHLQSKLLRVLQQQEFERIGESNTRKVDVRIIAATNRILEEAIDEKNFREDLFYRINSVRIKLVPLRERKEDIDLLVNYFIEKFSEKKNIRISKDALAALKLCYWNGNVRELENVVQRSVLLANGNQILLEDLPEEISSAVQMNENILSLDEMEKHHIQKVLNICKDLAEASNMLKIDPATLWRKRKKYNL
jgi:two-component system, NtrC family, response regulator AlgB